MTSGQQLSCECAEMANDTMRSTLADVPCPHCGAPSTERIKSNGGCVDCPVVGYRCHVCGTTVGIAGG